MEAKMETFRYVFINESACRAWGYLLTFLLNCDIMTAIT